MTRIPATVELISQITNVAPTQITLTDNSLTIDATDGLTLKDGYSFGSYNDEIFVEYNDTQNRQGHEDIIITPGELTSSLRRPEATSFQTVGNIRVIDSSIVSQTPVTTNSQAGGNIRIDSSVISQTPVTTSSQAGGSININTSSLISAGTINFIPQVTPDAYEVSLNTSLAVNRRDGVLANDRDNDEISASVETLPTNGQLTLQSDGAFTYQPNFGFIGQDSFTYSAFDEKIRSEVTTVSISVTSFPQPKIRGLKGSPQNNSLKGSKKNDYIQGLDGDDYIKARKGNDTVEGGTGRDFIKGKKGNDVLSGGNGDDYIKGGKGNDTIFGEADNDYLKGNKGRDLLIGGAGNDYLKGNKGNDTLYGGAGNDTLRGGRGNDIYVLAIDSGIDHFEKFKIGKDQLGLANGLSLGSLDFIQRNRSTLIRVEERTLAILKNVQASELNRRSNFIGDF